MITIMVIAASFFNQDVWFCFSPVAPWSIQNNKQAICSVTINDYMIIVI